MRKRGKKATNVVRADAGLLDDIQWSRYLQNYPTELIVQIRTLLYKQIGGLAEKFNRRSKYFGYRQKDGPDVIYIFVQKSRLVVLLRISLKFEEQIKGAGFAIHYLHNYQGRAGWLTGWRIPHDTKKIDFVVKMLTKAFE